jgi:hypothetical protein
MHLYEVEGRWSVADGGGWCAGVYDSEGTARYAHRMGAADMERMWADHAAQHDAPYPPMTRDQVAAWRRGQR